MHGGGMPHHGSPGLDPMSYGAFGLPPYGMGMMGPGGMMGGPGGMMGGMPQMFDPGMMGMGMGMTDERARKKARKEDKEKGDKAKKEKGSKSKR